MAFKTSTNRTSGLFNILEPSIWAISSQERALHRNSKDICQPPSTYYSSACEYYWEQQKLGHGSTQQYTWEGCFEPMPMKIHAPRPKLAKRIGRARVEFLESIAIDWTDEQDLSVHQTSSQLEDLLPSYSDSDLLLDDCRLSDIEHSVDEDSFMSHRPGLQMTQLVGYSQRLTANMAVPIPQPGSTVHHDQVDGADTDNESSEISWCSDEVSEYGLEDWLAFGMNELRTQNSRIAEMIDRIQTQAPEIDESSEEEEESLSIGSGTLQRWAAANRELVDSPSSLYKRGSTDSLDSLYRPHLTSDSSNSESPMDYYRSDDSPLETRAASFDRFGSGRNSHSSDGSSPLYQAAARTGNRAAFPGPFALLVQRARMHRETVAKEAAPLRDRNFDRDAGFPFIFPDSLPMELSHTKTTPPPSAPLASEYGYYDWSTSAPL